MIHWYEESSDPIQTELFMQEGKEIAMLYYSALWVCVCVEQLNTRCKKSLIALFFKVWSGLLISLWSRRLYIYMSIFSLGSSNGSVLQRSLIMGTLAAILSGESDAMLMCEKYTNNTWRRSYEVKTDHSTSQLEEFVSGFFFLCFFNINSLLAFSSLCLLSGCTCAWLCLSDSSKNDYRFLCSSYSPEKAHLFKVTQSPHTDAYTLPAFL